MNKTTTILIVVAAVVLLGVGLIAYTAGSDGDDKKVIEKEITEWDFDGDGRDTIYVLDNSGDEVKITESKNLVPAKENQVMVLGQKWLSSNLDQELKETIKERVSAGESIAVAGSSTEAFEAFLDERVHSFDSDAGLQMLSYAPETDTVFCYSGTAYDVRLAATWIFKWIDEVNDAEYPPEYYFKMMSKTEYMIKDVGYIGWTNEYFLERVSTTSEYLVRSSMISDTTYYNRVTDLRMVSTISVPEGYGDRPGLGSWSYGADSYGVSIVSPGSAQSGWSFPTLDYEALDRSAQFKDTLDLEYVFDKDTSDAYKLFTISPGYTIYLPDKYSVGEIVDNKTFTIEIDVGDTIDRYCFSLEVGV